MEIVVSAFLGELVQRSISSFIERLSKQETDVEENLRRKLLRVHVVVEEAEQRQIRNQAMLEQLKVLRDGLYRGYYVLDAIKFRACQEKSIKEQRHFCSALSRFNPAKRVHLWSSGGRHGDGCELQQVLDQLEIIITDVSEFVALLRGCSPLYRQPYSTHFVLEKCMFGRHVEMEYITNFLLHTGSHLHGSAKVDVLPIVGPTKSGKSTLIEHACNDGRVRKSLSLIVLFTEEDIKDVDATTIRKCGIIKHQNRSLELERILLIIEVRGDIDEDVWTSLYFSCKRYTSICCKIIISSRSGNIERFGTTRALRVECLTPEAYWYYFKVLTFGSTDPKEEPKLASMAMEIAAHLDGSFIVGNMIAKILRANFSAMFWRNALSCMREYKQRYPFLYGARSLIPWQETGQVYFREIGKAGRNYCCIFSDRQITSTQDETPMIKAEELWSGRITPPKGRFEALAWRSSIPPYYGYVLSYEMQKPRPVAVGRKRFQDSSP